MTHRRPNNLVELIAGTGTALVQGAVALVVAGFVVGALVLVLMR